MSLLDVNRGNAVSANTRQELEFASEEVRGMVARRRALLGPGYTLQYRRPVHPVRAAGTKIWDASGEELLDAYNNVPCVGHANPRVAKAMENQFSTINTNTRYLQDEILDYAESLLGTFSRELNRAMFFCTGSEANDVAIRLARLVTGHTGVIVSRFAYHGNTFLVGGISPGAGEGVVLDGDVRMIDAPDMFRSGSADLGARLARQVREQIRDLDSRGVGLAAFIVDGVFSSDGIFPADGGVLREAVNVARAAGAIFILDEVQTGFGRTGDDLWGYRRFGVLPDVLTLGKPMANGLPVAALVTQWDFLEDFGKNAFYFNTFAANNACIAAAHEVLSIIVEDGFLDNVRLQSATMFGGIKEILRQASCRSDVRGAGLFIGVEFVEDDENLTPASEFTENVVNDMRESGVLISSTGPFGNILKIRPPLVFSASDASRFLSVFEKTIRRTRG